MYTCKYFQNMRLYLDMHNKYTQYTYKVYYVNKTFILDAD